jgi:hypothetical protein
MVTPKVTSKALYAKKAKKKQFEVPPEGVPIFATLADIEDLGEVTSQYGSKPRLMFRWDTVLSDKEGKPIQVREYLTNTLHEKGKLAPRIFSLTGRMPDPDDETYDLMALIGTRAQIVVKHHSSEDGTVFANITSVVRQLTKEEAASEARVQRVIDSSKKKLTMPAEGYARPS